MMPSRGSKPSISVRIWFSVCSRSSWPPSAAPLPRERPIASSSSMKMIEGAASRACWNRSRTRAAPTPTIISMNSEAQRLKNGTPASPAIARASSVLPGAGRADQQHALRHRAAEPLVLLGVLQEVDDLDQLVLGLVDAGDVGEGDLLLGLAVALGAALPEAEDAARRRRPRRAATSQTKAPISSSVGPKPIRNVEPRGAVLVARVDHDALALEQRLEARIGEGRPLRLELLGGRAARADPRATSRAPARRARASPSGG